MRKLLLGLVLLLGIDASASNNIVNVLIDSQRQVIQDEARTSGLNWKVGDQNNYNLDMGFIKGTMTMRLREIVAEGMWLDQDMDLGFMGKQKAEILIDQNTGETKKLIVNGQEQQIPKNEMEVVEVKEDKITVPAGTFDCIHARLKDKSNNQESNAWINPQQIPLSGMLKMIQPGQFGNVTVLLTSFKKN